MRIIINDVEYDARIIYPEHEERLILIIPFTARSDHKYATNHVIKPQPISKLP